MSALGQEQTLLFTSLQSISLAMKVFTHILFQAAMSVTFALFWFAIMLSRNGIGIGWIVGAALGVGVAGIVCSMIYLANKYHEL